MIDEPFATGTSWIHRIDPHLRIVAAALYSGAVAVSHKFPVLAAAVTLSAVLATAARLNPAILLRRLLVVSAFIGLIWIMLPLTYEGHPLLQMGGITIFREGVSLSARITLKTISILLAFIALIATMPAATLGHSLGRMGFPQKLVLLLLLSYRYIFVLEKEYRRLWRAAKVRGFIPGTNRHSYRTYAYLIGMLFVRASQRAQRVYQAMRCRGFSGRFFTLHTRCDTGSNRVFGVLMTIALAGLIILEWSAWI